MSGAVPPGLGVVAPGPWLRALLAGIDPSTVPDERLLEVVSAQVRQLSFQQAQVWAVLAELATRSPVQNVPDAIAWTEDQVFDSAVDEVRAERQIVCVSDRGGHGVGMRPSK